MYNPIQLSHIPSKELNKQHEEFMDQFKLDPISSYSILETFDDSDVYDECDYNREVYTEAVFKNGKKSLDPIVELISEAKEELAKAIDYHEKSSDRETSRKFDPIAYWRNPVFKKLEDKIAKQFGFRYVEIEPYVEKYDSKKKEFESKILNCSVLKANRFPIEGLVTDDGFYDKSHSLVMEIHPSLGLIHELEPDEIMAVLLHEFGHGIDPAIMDINYTKINILSKYLTDREKELTKNERKLTENMKKKMSFDIIFAPVIAVWATVAGMLIIEPLKALFNKIKVKFAKKRVEEYHKDDIENGIEYIRKLIRRDKEFSRRTHAEAFADNFARMYGFGPSLMSGLRKIAKSGDDKRRSRIQKEKDRQYVILSITEATIKDIHKTNIHRAKALIKEYEEDLKDPNIPKSVKKDIEEDLKEVQTILDSYLNDFQKFQNRVNKVILEELENLGKENSKNDGKKDDINESTESMLEDDLFEEKSHGKLKYDFRLAFDSKTGHYLKIVYSLDDIEIDIPNELYHKSVTSKGVKKYKEFSNEAFEKNISKDGNLDHFSKNQMVLAIVDLNTGKNLKEAHCYGPFYRNVLNPDHIKVGQRDKKYNFKSTFWPKGTTGRSISDIERREDIGIGRGMKVHNVSDQRELQYVEENIRKFTDDRVILDHLHSIKDGIKWYNMIVTGKYETERDKEVAELSGYTKSGGDKRARKAIDNLERARVTLLRKVHSDFEKKNKK